MPRYLVRRALGSITHKELAAAHRRLRRPAPVLLDRHPRLGRAPGGPLRAIYHPHYYGAYVLDPDGNNIEACCHAPA